MNYRMYSPLLVLILVSMIACAQEKQSIKDVQLFSRVHMPGNIPVNEKGEPLMGPDTVYSILVETTGKPVQWKAAFTKNKTYTIVPSLVSNLPYDAGTNDATGQKILLSPAKGNQLWLLDLQPAEAGSITRPAVAGPGIMQLQGKTGSKTFTYTIQRQVNIQMLPVY